MLRVNSSLNEQSQVKSTNRKTKEWKMSEEFLAFSWQIKNSAVQQKFNSQQHEPRKRIQRVKKFFLFSS